MQDSDEKIFKQAKIDTLEWLRQEVSGLRSGRIKPGMVEAILVESYGTRSPLNGLASVNSADARTLTVSPWDASTITSIKKALTEANLGVQPVVDGNIIRLSFPSLTEEVRTQTIKILHTKAEEARVRLRQARDDAIKMLKEAQDKSDITEDDFYDSKKLLDELISGANAEIEDLIKAKEEEIRAV